MGKDSKSILATDVCLSPSTLPLGLAIFSHITAGILSLVYLISIHAMPHGIFSRLQRADLHRLYVQ